MVAESLRHRQLVDVATFRKESPVKKIALALALLLGAAVTLPVIGASPADAQTKCHYTSGDKAKGYRC